MSDNFPIITRNENGKIIHRKSKNYEVWKEYDERGNLVKTLSSTGMQLTWKYDKNNNILEFRESDKWYHKFTYYENGSLQYAEYFKKGEDEKYWYDEDGNVVHKEYIPAPVKYAMVESYMDNIPTFEEEEYIYNCYRNDEDSYAGYDEDDGAYYFDESDD